MPRKKKAPEQIEQNENIAAVFTPIDQLTEWSDNPRQNQKAISKVAASIKRFGFASPIIANRENMVIAGHTRLAAAKSLGLTHVPVRFMKLDPVESKLLALADNKIGEVADWDNTLLTKVLTDLKEEGLQDLGFSDEELDSFINGSGDDYTDHWSEDDDDIEGDGLQAGEIHQVTLWYSAEEHEEFMSLIQRAQEKLNTNTTTETVLHVFRIASCF